MCNDTFNTLQVTFRTNWSLLLNYTLKDKTQFVLNNLRLDYDTFDQSLFPNVDKPSKLTVAQSDMNLFSANKGNSYKCWSKTEVEIEQVNFVFTNYQAEPFLDGKTTDFDTGKLIIFK
jgi:hypothetical protein